MILLYQTVNTPASSKRIVPNKKTISVSAAKIFKSATAYENYSPKKGLQNEHMGKISIKEYNRAINEGEII